MIGVGIRMLYSYSDGFDYFYYYCKKKKHFEIDFIPYYFVLAIF